MTRRSLSVLSLCLLSTSLLQGCFAGGVDFPKVGLPGSWYGEKDSGLKISPSGSMKAWWLSFGDPVLGRLVDVALAGNPDRKSAEARIAEARGQRRTSFAGLFPRVGASADKGHEKAQTGRITDTYDANFDASYEIDVFGKNRKAASAAELNLRALEASYEDTSLSLVAEVARTYVEMRGFQKQVNIARDNLAIQEQTLKLVKQLKEAGEGPQLDVERSENLVNTTRASLPDFERQARNAMLRLTILTGEMPRDLLQMVQTGGGMLKSNVAPVLSAPASVLALRPDIRAASATLAEQTALSESVTAEIFPTFTVTGLFGVADNAIANSATIWNVGLGTAVSVLDFGRIAGKIDSARAREVQAYQAYRKVILEAVVDVETALNDYAKINAQSISLAKAHDNARKALSLSQALYKEGEVSFLDVLDAERTVNTAESSLVTAQVAQAQALVRLYKSLSVGL